MGQTDRQTNTHHSTDLRLPSTAGRGGASKKCEVCFKPITQKIPDRLRLNHRPSKDQSELL